MKRLLPFLLLAGLVAVGNVSAQSPRIPQVDVHTRIARNARYRLDKISVPDSRQIFDYFYKEETIPTKIQTTTGGAITSIDSLFYEDDRLVQVRYFDNNLELKQAEKYVYDGSKLVLREFRKSPTDETPIKKVSYHYLCGSDMPFEITTEMSDGYFESHTLDYLNGKIARIDIMTQQNPSAELIETGRMVYEFDANNDAILLRDSVFLPLQNKWVEMFTHRYTYDNKHNCIRWEQDEFGTLTLANNFEYDTTIPLSSVLFPTHEEFFRPLLPNFMKHMRTKQTYFNNSGEGLSEVCDYNYFYTDMQGNALTDVAVNESIKIYPRPATDFLRIEGSQLLRLSLFDMNGKLIRATELTGDLAIIGVASLPRGTYIAEITAANSKTIRAKVSLR